LKLNIEKAIYGAAGLARAEGKAVFVPMALPGETVEVATKREKSSFAEAELLEVLATSPDRVAAPCPYYGACGGCQYQHASYEAQLAMKRNILEETLGRAGLRDLPEIATHAREPWGYRNRIRLHVDAANHALGYRRRGSHALLPVEFCPIAAPLLETAIAALGDVFREEKSGSWCAEVELFINEESSTLLLSLGQRQGARAGLSDLQQVCEVARERIPALRGAGLFAPAAPRDTRQGTRRGRGGQKALADEPDGEAAAGSLLAVWGEGTLVYRVGGNRYRVSLGAFFQGNRFLVDKLTELATTGPGGALAWDLFAGVGLFAQVLTGRFDRVVAVEGSPISAGNLRQNLPEGKDRVVASSTLAFLERFLERPPELKKREVPDLVVLDPPRAGLGAQASSLLARVRSPHITYVSCDPATLSRDLRVMVDAGYTISQLDLLDMFPQTFHLETVARLRLR